MAIDYSKRPAGTSRREYLAQQTAIPAPQPKSLMGRIEQKNSSSLNMQGFNQMMSAINSPWMQASMQVQDEEGQQRLNDQTRMISQGMNTNAKPAFQTQDFRTKPQGSFMDSVKKSITDIPSKLSGANTWLNKQLFAIADLGATPQEAEASQKYREQQGIRTDFNNETEKQTGKVLDVAQWVSPMADIKEIALGIDAISGTEDVSKILSHLKSMGIKETEATPKLVADLSAAKKPEQVTDILNKYAQADGIKSAAVKVGDKTYEGASHAEAVLKAKQAGEDVSILDKETSNKFGFTDKKGNFLTRAETEAKTGNRNSSDFPQLKSKQIDTPELEAALKKKEGAPLIQEARKGENDVLNAISEYKKDSKGTSIPGAKTNSELLSRSLDNNPTIAKTIADKSASKLKSDGVKYLYREGSENGISWSTNPKLTEKFKAYSYGNSGMKKIPVTDDVLKRVAYYDNAGIGKFDNMHENEVILRPLSQPLQEGVAPKVKTFETPKPPKEEGLLAKAKKAKAEKDAITQQNKSLDIIKQSRNEKEVKAFTEDVKNIAKESETAMAKTETDTSGFSKVKQFVNKRLKAVRNGTFKISEEAPVVDKSGKPRTPVSKDEVRQIIGNRFAVAQSLEIRGNSVGLQAQRFLKSAEDTKLFRAAIEKPSIMESNAAKSSNPTEFKKLAQMYSDLTDYSHAELTKSGSELGFIENYYSHLVDLSTPAAQAKFQAWIGKLKNSQGYFNKSRIFSSIGELEQEGFTLKNKTVGQDISDYMAAVKKELSGSTFFNDLKKAFPEHIENINEVGLPPSDFFQLRIPGMKGTFVSPDLFKQLKNLEPQELTGTFGKILDATEKTTTQLKNWRLQALFHTLNTGLKYTASSIGELQMPRLDKILAATFSKSYRLHYMQDAIEKGVIDKASMMGVSIGKIADVSTFADSAASKAMEYSPSNLFHQGTFEGAINTMKIEMVNKMKVDLSTKAGVAQARDMGYQLNNLFGGINTAVLQRNPIVQKLAKIVFLAPDFNEGKVRTVMSALNITKWGKANNFARKAIVGQIVLVGVMAELGRRLVTGKFSQNFKDALQNDILDPNVPISYTNKAGKTLRVGLPGSTTSDVTRFVEDPKQGIQSRGSSVLSLAARIWTGKDYYGNNINWTSEASTLLPIYVEQVGDVALGQENAITAAMNIAGLRVSTDKGNVANKTYYQLLQDKVNALPPQYQDIFKSKMTFAPMTPEEAQMYADKKGAVADFKPTFDSIEAQAKNGQIDEANKAYDALKPSDQKMFDTMEKTMKTNDTQMKEIDMVQQVADAMKLAKTDPTAANKQYDSLSDDDKRIFDLTQKRLEKAPTINKTTSSSNIVDTAILYGKSIATDPVTAFNRIITGQRIVKLVNGTIIVQRMDVTASQAIKDQLVQNEGGTPQEYELDHIVPLSLGGSNSKDNLKLVPIEIAKEADKVETFLAKELSSGDISRNDAQKRMRDFKNGDITIDEAMK